MKAVASAKADATERQQKEAALQRVRINKDDVELLVSKKLSFLQFSGTFNGTLMVL